MPSSIEALPVPAPDAPLSEVAHHALMGMLLSGALQPNEVLTERQIALQLGISRTPMREAVRRLEGARFLERQKNGALVVRPLPVEEFMHILGVRRLLEGEAARLAAGRAATSAMQALRARIAEVAALPADAAAPDMAGSGHDLHLLIAAACGNPVLAQGIDDLRTRTAMFRFGRLPSRRDAVCAEHLAIVDALLAGDAAAAQRAMQHHIDQVRATILTKLGGQ